MKLFMIDLLISARDSAISITIVTAIIAAYVAITYALGIPAL